MLSVESSRRTPRARTALAPVAWGSAYFVTETFLPPDRPLFAAMVRALPFGLCCSPFAELPPGGWWWRAVVLGTLNIGLFFPLIFVAAYRLPGGLAATLHATAPIGDAGLAWPGLGERPRAARCGRRRRRRAGGRPARAALGLRRRPGRPGRRLRLRADLGAGLRAGQALASPGRQAHASRPGSWSSAAWCCSRSRCWSRAAPAPRPAGRRRLPLARRGRDLLPTSCWFLGLRRLPAGVVSLIGLVNPVVGTVLGVALAGELFGWTQASAWCWCWSGARRPAGGRVAASPPSARDARAGRLPARAA